MIDCEVCQFLGKSSTRRRDFECWTAELAHDQEYLGKLVISARRHVSTLSELTKREVNELGLVFRVVESALSAVFEPDYFNWSCLMNNAWKAESPAHVHFHAIPRYNCVRNLGDEYFIDSRFGHSARSIHPHLVGYEVANQIYGLIDEAFTADIRVRAA